MLYTILVLFCFWKRALMQTACVHNVCDHDLMTMRANFLGSKFGLIVMQHAFSVPCLTCSLFQKTKLLQQFLEGRGFIS